jgi:hypothetical protein
MGSNPSFSFNRNFQRTMPANYEYFGQDGTGLLFYINKENEYTNVSNNMYTRYNTVYVKKNNQFQSCLMENYFFNVDGVYYKLFPNGKIVKHVR